MKTLETIYENYKASYNEETPQTEEQETTFIEFNCIMEALLPTDNPKAYRQQQRRH